LATARSREIPRHENARFPMIHARGFHGISARPSADCRWSRTTKNRDLDGEFASWKRVLA